MGASTPPATMASTVPSRMSSQAYPMESIPEVHPAETMFTGPSAPASQATSAARELGTK
ncbi:hypothetical protein SVIOM74S_00383 [Streptomyces violarus]